MPTPKPRKKESHLKRTNIKLVQDWIGLGWSKKRILREIEYIFGYSSDTSKYNLYNDAIADLYPETQKEFVRKSIDVKLENIIEEAIKDSDRRNAIRALDIQAKLNKLYQPDEMSVDNGDTTITVKFG